VYSYGVLAYEVFSRGRLPFDALSNETLLKVLEGRDSFVHVHIKNMEARVQSAEDRLAEMQAIFCCVAEM
jgi:hypothetical protein